MARPLLKQGTNLLSLSSIINNSAQIFARSIKIKVEYRIFSLKGVVLIHPERIKNAMSLHIGDKLML